MAASTGPVLATGGVTLFRIWIINKKGFADGLKVVAATGIAVIALAGLEKLSREGAVGIAYIALVTSLIAPVGGKAALEDIAVWINRTGI